MKEALTLKETQSILFNMLKLIKEFCDKKGLLYYLGYGSLIGTLRHEGFIPWDDDIDILMPRDDYEKLIESYKEFNTATGLSLRHYKVDDDYTYPFIKIQEDGTYTDQKCSAIKNMGINIDILPIDKVPENYHERESFLRGRYKSYTDWRASNEWDFYNWGWRKHFILTRIKNLFISNKELAKRFDEYCAQYSRSESGFEGVILMVRSYMDSTVPIGYYGTSRTGVFEGERFRIPNQAEILLDRVYCNWREVPSDNKDKWARNHKYYLK